MTESITPEAETKTEDTAHVTGDRGEFMLGVRNSAGAALTDTDGDYSPVAVTSTGAIQVDSTKTEDAVHASGSQGAFILGVRNAAGITLTSADGDYSPVSVNAQGNVQTVTPNLETIGTITADEGTVAIGAPTGRTTAGLQITGTWVATLVWEGTVDDTNWFPINAVDVQNAAVTTGTTSNGEWLVGIAGFGGIRVRADAFTSGTVNVTWRASQGTSLVIASDGGGSMTVDGTVGVSGAVDTELPPAAALGDNTSNPTVPAVGSFPHVWDGATWDRIPGDSAQGMDIDPTRNPPRKTVTDTITATNDTTTLALDSAGTVAVQVTGTWVATLDFQGTVDGSTWFSISALDADSAALVRVNQAATNGGYFIPAAGLHSVRLIASAFTSGTATVTMSAAAGSAVNWIDGLQGVTIEGGDIDSILSVVSTSDQSLSASTLADDFANGTAPPVWSHGAVFDGTTWDRQRGNSAGGTFVQGPAAADAAVAGNPVLLGGRASTAQPTDVSADGDAVSLWLDQKGSIVPVAAPHVGLLGEPWSLVHEAAQYTGTQTSTVLIAGGASEKLVVTKVQIQVGGTTAGTLQLYFGTGAFSRGTSRAIFDGEFAPSATLKPGVIMDGPFISGTNGDDLLVTTSAAINPLTINVWYYVIT